MKELFSTLFQGVNLALGLVVFAGLMWFIIRAHAYWWRRVAEKYAGHSRGTALAAKAPETVIITGRPGSREQSGYRIYGAGRFVLLDEGLWLVQIPPFNILCPPLFLPFDEMKMRQTDWGATEVFALEMKGLPSLDIIVFPRVVSWVRERVDDAPFGLGV